MKIGHSREGGANGVRLGARSARSVEWCKRLKEVAR